MAVKFNSELTLEGLMKIGAVCLSALVVAHTWDARLTSVETRQTQSENNRVVISAAMDKMIDFVKNSDGYHSASTGAQFENGKPLDPGFEKMRRFVGNAGIAYAQEQKEN